MLPYRDAVKQLVHSASRLDRASEEVPLQEGIGRVLATSVCLDRAEPPVARSAMDGFALRSADGIQLREILGSVYAGTAEVPKLQTGQAVAVMTGGTVPPGADAVVPVELTEVQDGQLRIQAELKPGQHVRRAGEMGESGRAILNPGQLLGPADLTAAAGCGTDPVLVYARPRVAVLSTGDEVISWQDQPADHQVRDSNRLGVALQVQRAGGAVVSMQRVRDEPSLLRAALVEALEEADLTITIGGVSMGEKDHLPVLFHELGIHRLFHGVSVQPGKPIWAGKRDNRWVLGLPGNPVSSFVTLELFGVPLLRKLAGASPRIPRPLQKGIAGGPSRTKARERFVPADLQIEEDGTVLVTPRPETGSGDWTCLAQSRALMYVPAHGSVREGQDVRYLSL